MVLVAGCQPAPPDARYNILEHGERVAPALLQGYGVADRLNWGLAPQDLGDMQLYTLEANDLLGYPFVTIVMSAPVEAADAWSLLAGVRGSEWRAGDEASAWTTTLIGSTTVRDTLIVSNVGLDLPLEIFKTVRAMGGLSRFKEIVAIESQVFAVRDVAGALWRIDSKEAFTADETRFATESYQAMFDANNTREVQKLNEERWAEFLADAEAALSTQAGVGSIADFTRPDGFLDVPQVRDFLEARSASLEPETRYPDRRECFLFICQGIRQGYMPKDSHGNFRPVLNAFRDGGSQTSDRFDRSGNFLLSVCAGGSSSVEFLGCAPTAFVGLIEYRFTQKGDSYFGVTYNGGAATSVAAYHNKTQVKALMRSMTAPTSSGRPLIADYMGTCWVSGFGSAGALTLGSGFVAGAKRFLREQDSSLHVVSNVSHYAGNVTSAPAKANILIGNIGIRNNPVITEYFYGFAQGHFSPVTEYAVYDSGANGLNIKTLTHPTTWYSLSGTWGTERGVFALE